MENRFAATCGQCKTEITSRDGGATWRHREAPTVKHRPYASGVMRQI
jgi:hypothetical protein